MSDNGSLQDEDVLEKMSFWDHVSALRSMILKVFGVVIALSLVFFAIMPDLFDNVILAPCKSDFFLYHLLGKIIPYFSTTDVNGSGLVVDLINIQLTSQILIHMTTSFWLGIIFSFPFIIYSIWQFIKPALYDNERRGIKKVFFFGNFMFYLGVTVGYCIVFPFSLRFLAGYQVSEMVPNQISLSSYMDNFLLLVFTTGLMFELPLVALMLSRAGILTRSFFNKYRRHAIAILMIVAAIITPADPFSMVVLFIPLYCLWELSSFFVKPAPKESDEEKSQAVIAYTQNKE
ncbi:MAG: twin-arginine translocase subunit TatC [Muribaculaceae bacterium]|nr:twin-arginine translocase subunit TatC [Muribaculaceae bacterium]